MKKFVLIYNGYQEPTPEVMSAWMTWFATVGDRIVDSGNPFGAGREVTTTGSRDITADPTRATGYSIVNADSMEDAERLLQGCPVTDGVRIYEAMAM